MMKTHSVTTPKLYIGLDVHKAQTSVAIADPGASGEVRSHGNIPTTQPSIEKMLRRIAKSKKLDLSELHVCYESGGCGMWIARQLMKMKVPCTIVAPSLIPSKAGDQVKTDKKDAIKLARLLRAGELAAVHVPHETDEAIRDLCRARVGAVDDLRRVKTRLLVLFHRLGHNYIRKSTWTEAHKRYIGDFVRFTHSKQLMSYLGLTPGEYFSGGKQKQSSITQCGNSHLRWMLVECATHYRIDPEVTSALSKRQEGQPNWVKELSWKAQNRLNIRYKKLQSRLMQYNKIKVSIARELTGVI
jgi:transposase